MSNQPSQPVLKRKKILKHKKGAIRNRQRGEDTREAVLAMRDELLAAGVVRKHKIAGEIAKRVEIIRRGKAPALISANHVRDILHEDKLQQAEQSSGQKVRKT